MTLQCLPSSLQMPFFQNLNWINKYLFDISNYIHISTVQKLKMSDRNDEHTHGTGDAGTDMDDDVVVCIQPPVTGGDDEDEYSVEDEDDEEVDEVDEVDEMDEIDVNNDIDSYFEDSFGSILTDKPLKKRIRLIKIVAPNNRITSNFITKLEMARAKGLRAEQIDTNGFSYTDTDNCGDAISIAEKEFFDRRSPLILCRLVGKKKNKVIEKWSVREMSYPVGAGAKV
jgi:hypothetical protein